MDDFIRKWQLEEFDLIEFKIIRNSNPIVGRYGSVLRYYKGQLSLITEFEDIEFGHIRWGKGEGRLIERALKHLRPNLMFYYRDEDILDDIDMAVVTLTDCPKMSNGWISMFHPLEVRMHQIEAGGTIRKKQNNGGED